MGLSNPNRKPYFISHEHLSFDEIEAALKAWRIEILRLDRHPTQNGLTQLDTGMVLLSHGIFGGRTEQRGDPPKGLRTFAILADRQSQLVWRKKGVPLNGMMIFPHNSEVDVVTGGPRVEVFTLSLPEPYLNRFSSVYNQSDFDDLVNGRDLIELSSYGIARLRQIIFNAVQSLSRDSALCHEKAFQEDFNTNIGETLTACLIPHDYEFESDRTTRSDRIWHRIEQYIKANNDRCLKVGEICNEAGISESTLLRIFKFRFGVSPKTYLNTHRLHAVRRILKNSDSKKQKVSDVANNLGFWHMGQFAMDYRRLFGELPSQTLTKL